MKNIEEQVSLFYQKLRKILYFSGESNNIDFLISSITEYNPFYGTEEIVQWLNTINKEQYFDVVQCPLTRLDKWSFNEDTGDLQHDSGGFFQIKGLKVETNWGNVRTWSQPIIYQPEIGILGIITKKINGILYFLLQAKAEPGNINTHQLSPTVQATRSNYKKIHGGKSTLYLEYFLDSSKADVLLDQLQSEQGARFYHKRNRNIIVRIPYNHEIELSDNYRWLTLGQLLKLAQKDNTVNMDTRSVISNISLDPEYVTSRKGVTKEILRKCVNDFPLATSSITDFGINLISSSHQDSYYYNSFDELLMKITKRKFECEFDVQLIPLNRVKEWVQTKNEIYHPDRKFFSVIGVHIEAKHREVRSWDQPIIKQDYPGIVGFITKEIEGTLHILTQLKMECGVMDLLEISPTVQCITSNYSVDDMPLFVDELLYRKKSKTIIDVFQSEEGGRFYRESNQNIILLGDDSLPIEEPPGFLWMTISQLKHFIKFNNLVNVESRSLLACMSAL